MKVKYFMVFIFLIISFQFALYAKENNKSIEHVLWTRTGYDFGPWVNIVDPIISQKYDSGTLYSFNVPPSKKNSNLIFDFSAGIFYKRGEYDWCMVQAWAYLWFRSDSIPDNIDVYGIFRIEQFAETNPSLKKDYFSKAPRVNFKEILRNDDIDYWQIKYKETGETVPDDIALPLLEELIRKGFTIDLSYSIKFRGITSLKIGGFYGFVSRITKQFSFWP